MTDTTYEGWTNYATWNVVLWIDNEYSIYQAKVEAMRQVGKKPWCEFTAESVKAFALDYFPNGTPDMQDDDTDPNYNMTGVNWQEIADHWNLEAADIVDALA